MVRKKIKKIICHCGIEFNGLIKDHEETEEHIQRILNIEIDKRKFFKRRKTHDNFVKVEPVKRKINCLSLDFFD